MRKARGDLSQARLKELLSYDPDTGEFVRLVDVRGGARTGDKCRRLSSAGYYQIGVDGWAYLAHRLAWLYMTGEWPADQVDHINGVRDDNRWDNLRQATQAQNCANKKRHRNNTSGYKGVSYEPRRAANARWVAQIYFDGRTTRLGAWATAEEAHRAYAAAAEMHFGEFARAA